MLPRASTTSGNRTRTCLACFLDVGKPSRNLATKTNPDDETTRYNKGRAELRGLQFHIILGL